MKESGGKEYGLPFLFSFTFCQACHPIHPENHEKKGSLLFLQEIGYKKANGS